MTNGLPVISIGTRAFNEKVLTNVYIPDSIVNIGSYAFFGCIGPTSITIPVGVINIGAYSFLSTSLTNIVLPDRSVVVPDTSPLFLAFFMNGRLCRNGMGASEAILE